LRVPIYAPLDQTITEGEFWGRMEMRVCRELCGMDDPVLRHMWCDGIQGGVVRPQAGRAYLGGTIWIGRDGQTEMQFEMALPETISIERDINWKDLLPSEDLTGWLAVDLQRKRVTIDIGRGERLQI